MHRKSVCISEHAIRIWYVSMYTNKFWIYSFVHIGVRTYLHHKIIDSKEQPRQRRRRQKNINRMENITEFRRGQKKRIIDNSINNNKQRRQRKRNWEKIGRKAMKSRERIVCPFCWMIWDRFSLFFLFVRKHRTLGFLSFKNDDRCRRMLNNGRRKNEMK